MRRSLTLALAFVGLSAGLAQAGTPLLPPAKHKVAVKSWQSKGSYSKKQGMHVLVTDAHPESKIVIERQGRSGHAEIPAKLTSEEQLIHAAEGATRWHEHTAMVTENDRAQEPHQMLVMDPAKVMRPNSRFRVKATTRDGQKVDSHGHVVEGLAAQAEQRFNVLKNTAEDVSLSGRNIKTARVWVEPHNLFVSAPSTDEKMISEGQAKLALAKQHGEHIVKEQAEIEQGVNTSTDLTMEEKQVEVARLTAEKAQLEHDGQALVTEGSRSISRIVSVGAFPVATSVRAANQRLVGDAATKHSFSVASSSESGYMHQDIEALGRDKVKLAVSFDHAQANHSTQTLSFRIPSGDEKPAFELDGRKYYRAHVEHTETTHAEPQ